MKVIETSIKGALLLEPRIFKDARGSFYETWRKEGYKKYGIQEEFLQDNISVANKNVLKGLHYQKNQGQMAWVSYGKIFAVIADIRPHSDTFKKYFSIELSSEQPQQLYMPPDCAYGFCVLSDFAIVNYKCTQYYNPHEEGGIIWNDPEIGIQWPVKNPIISGRDLTFDTLLKSPQI